jgi:gliding motility-associated-like protein
LKKAKNKQMKKGVSAFVISLLLLCMFLLNPFRSCATHIVAVDMTYKWQFGNTYQITVVLYGDCGPASASAFSGLPLTAPEICIYNGNTFFRSISLAIQDPICGIEITPVICPGTITQCTDPSSLVPGIKQFTYLGSVTLPGVSQYWRFIYDGSGGSGTGTVTCNGTTFTANSPTSGRGATITNIQDAGNSIIQLTDTLDNTLGHNSSPEMTILPTPYFCVNSDNCYSPGAIDRYDSTASFPAGDSLVFALKAAATAAIDPMSGRPTCSPNGGGDVTYIGEAWSYPTAQAVTGATPLQVDSANQFSFDGTTGQICFLPSLLQRSDVVYNIREYRNGAFIGSCQREMTFLVQQCTNSTLNASYSAASIGVIKDSTSFQICSGAGDFSMNMSPTDNDPVADITVVSGTLPPGATFNTTGNNSPHPQCLFKWTTNGIDTGSFTYTVTFSDNHCPYPGRLVRTFHIRITPPLLLTSKVVNDICNAGKGTIKVLTTGGAAPYSYQWSNGMVDSMVSGLQAGTYTVTTSDQSSCKNTFTISLGDDTVNLLITPTIKKDICKTGNGAIKLQADGGVAPYGYLWSNDSAGSAISALPAGTYSVVVTDFNGCKNGISVDVDEDICPEIVVHDVITPNSDGLNDVWVIEGILNYPKNMVQIFDKWGDKLYEQHAYSNDWNGKGTKGELLPDGTYFYLVKLNAVNAAGGQSDFKGSLLIKR